MSYDTSTTTRAAEAKPKKLGRNSPCPCGSGAKCKRCCLETREVGFDVNPTIAKAAVRNWPKKFAMKAGVAVEL